MSDATGLHVRTGSIKRTPSDLSRSLAAVNLPPPSAITAAGRKKDEEDAASGMNDRLRNLDLDEPEGEQFVTRKGAAAWRVRAGVVEAWGPEQGMNQEQCGRVMQVQGREVSKVARGGQRMLTRGGAVIQRLARICADRSRWNSAHDGVQAPRCRAGPGRRLVCHRQSRAGSSRAHYQGER